MAHKIDYKERPSNQALENYRQKLEKFLSAHYASITIKLRNEPLRIESYINGEHDSTDYHWVEDIRVSTPKIKDLSVSVISEGIDENINDEVVWHDAFFIQDQIYQRLALTPKLPPATSSDPYWKLWDYLK